MPQMFSGFRPDEVVDVIVEPLYDCQTILAAGASLLTYFQVPQGQGATNWGAATIAKNLSDTNMDQGGSLPAGYKFVVQGFRVMPAWTVNAADAVTWALGAVLTFTIGSKPFLRAPLVTIPAGMGVQGFYTQAMAAAAAITSHGVPHLSNSYGVAAKPFELQSNENFAVTLTWPSGARANTSTVSGQAAAGLPVYVFIDGFKYRRVQ